MNPAVSVLHADCLWLPHLGVDADAMIVDPPYAANVHARATSARTGGVGVRSRDFGFESLSPALMTRIAQYAAQVRRWTVVCCDVESSHLWRAEMALAGVEYVRAVPWIRWTQPQLSGDRPPSGREETLWFHRKGRKRWNGPGNLTHMDHKALRATRGATADKHPTEKPLDQLLDLVSWVTDPGETVIDPCGGAGTTALAAWLLGRGAVVLERDAAWYRNAHTRLWQAAGPDEGDGVLCARDSERVRRWVERTCEEASRVPYPRKTFEEKTYERAQRRILDVPRVVASLEGT